MKPRPMVVALAVALTAGMALAPSLARADRPHGRGGRPIAPGHPGVAHKPFAHSHSRLAPPFAHHRPFFHHRPFVPFVVATAPSVVYTAPPVYYPPPLHYPPVFYPPPPVYAAPPVYGPPANGAAAGPPAPLPRVVQHPHGRYELRGDGIAVPYRWVWIPNPPPPPPQVDAPPDFGGGAPSAPPGTRRQSELYRWTDEQGVVHWTDRRDAVPEQYRERAKARRPS